MRRMITMFNLLALALTSSAIAEQERDLWYAVSIAGALGISFGLTACMSPFSCSTKAEH